MSVISRHAHHFLCIRETLRKILMIHLYIEIPSTLRIMGSQNWWFGDPRPLLCTSKPRYRRVQWFLGQVILFAISGCKNPPILQSIQVLGSLGIRGGSQLVTWWRPSHWWGWILRSNCDTKKTPKRSQHYYIWSKTYSSWWLVTTHL